MSTVHAALVPGIVLGDRYEILEILGEGGMGAVYKARDIELNRLVALKVIRADLAGNKAIIDRFKQELILAHQVTHKNVIRIYDLGEAGGTKFITMEYIEGEDLRGMTRRLKKLPRQEAVEIIQQVCRALEAAHVVGIIHRDLKPQNIMRDKTGRILVMDFGLARTLEGDGMTQTGALVGTMEYMSPEQALAKDLDQRSDLFTVGLILYELLTGEMPFKAESALASLIKRTQERVVPVSDHDNDIPAALSNIVSKCLERDPNMRYQSATELLADLETWEGKRAGKLRFLGRSWKQVVPWRVIAPIAAGVIVVTGGFLFRGKIFHGSFSGTQQVAAAPAVSLAILPFRNASADLGVDWLGSSLAEMLSTDVGQSAHLRTISPDRLHQVLSDLRISPDAIIDSTMLRRVAEFSNADIVISGQYTKLGDQIRIDATLRDLKRDRTAPLKVQAMSEKDLSAAVDQLAEAIRQNLAVSPDIVKELRAQSFKPSTTSLDALRNYNQGLELIRRGNNLEAVKSFEAAIKDDPRFALGYSRLGETYSALGYDNDAEQASRKAVDLSQQLPLPEKYLIQATRARLLKDNKKAIEYYENLAKVTPNDSTIELTLARLYEDTGSYDTARDYLGRVLAREPKHAEALVALAHVEGERRNPQGALDYLGSALALAVQLDNDELKSRVLYETGYVYRLLNKPAEALRNYEDSLVIRRRLGQKAGIAQSLAEIAEIQYTQGKPAEAIASYKEAMQLQRQIGDKTYLSHTLLNLGGIYSDRAQYDDALKYLKESLQMQRELRNENYEAMCLNNIGNVYFSTEHYGDALTNYQQALQLMEKLKIEGEIPAVLYNLGDTSVRTAQFDEAVSYYLRGLDLARKAGNKQLTAVGSFSLGSVFKYQGRYGAALSAQEDAVKTYRESQDRSPMMIESLNGFGQTLAMVGRDEESRRILEEALRLARDTKDETNTAQALNFQGERLFYSGDLKSAKPLFEQAMQAAIRSKDREKILGAKLSLAILAVQEGRSQEALASLKRLSVEADTLGLKYASVRCSVFLAEALVATRNYRAAREEADRALRESEKFGFRLLAARSHYLAGEISRFTGKRGEALAQYQQARQGLQDISSEAHADSFLKRSDLTPILSSPKS